MIDSKTYYALAIMSLVFFISCYFYIRGILWSIALCNINKKVIRSAEFKKNKNISMTYLSAHIGVFHAEYVFWMIFKIGYVIIESIWLLTYLFLPLFVDNIKIPFYINVLQTFIISSIIIFQRDQNRDTKFDRYRLNKKRKK